MANKKYHYYVLVLSSFGPVFVTGRDREFSYWDKEKTPMDYGSKKFAEDEAYGLRLNGYPCYAITVPYEIDYQPYLYENGKWEWVSNKKGDE